MAIDNNYKVEITDSGKEQMNELMEKVWAWMGPENTVGDFMTTFMEEVVEEWLGEDVCSTTMAELDDHEVRRKVLKRICESPMMDVFKKVKKPEDL